MTAPTADELEIHTRTLSMAATAILQGLAKAKYDGQKEVTGELLRDLGVVLPSAVDVEKALEVLLFLTKLTAPAADTANCTCRFVPATNSFSTETVEQFA